MTVPVASVAATSTTSQGSKQTASKDQEQVGPDTATSKVILKEDDDDVGGGACKNVNLASPKDDRTVADVTDDIVPKIPESYSGLGTRVMTDATPLGLNTSATIMPPPATVSLTSFCLSRTPEDQVGASKEAMTQVELMNRRLKEAYDSGETLKANIRKAYVRSENALLHKRLGNCVSVESTKKALEDKDIELAKAWESTNAKTKKAKDTLKDIDKVKKLNKTLTKTAEAMKKEIVELKISYSEWDEKFKDLSDASAKSKKDLEDKVSKLTKKKSDLKDFNENEVELVNQKLEDDRVNIAMRYITRLKQSMRDVEEVMFPEEDVGGDVEAFLGRLKEIPDQVRRWKKSTAQCGVHFKKVDEAKLQALSVVNPKGRNFQDYLVMFIEAATRIADAIDPNTFIDPVGPSSSPEAGGDQA